MTLKILIWLFYGSSLGTVSVFAWRLVFPFFQNIFGIRFLSKKKKRAKAKASEDQEASAEQEKKLAGEKERGVKKIENTDIIPREVIGLIRRAETMIARKEYDDSKKILIRVLSLDPENINASSHLAYAYLQTGEYKKAETLFKKVLEKKPKDPSVLTNYALCIFEQKDITRIEDSINALRLATEIDSHNANRYSNLGQSYFFARDIPSAISAFEQAVRLEPKNLEYNFFLADSFLSIEKYPEAKSVFQKILEISPLNKDAQEEIKTLEKKGY